MKADSCSSGHDETGRTSVEAAANAPQVVAPEKAYSTDEEHYNFDSLWDALDHLDANGPLVAGMTVYEGDVVKRRAGHFAPNTTWLVDQMSDAAYDEGGEFAEGFPDVADDKLKELQKLIADWLDANVEVNFFTITNPRQITVTEELIAEFRAEAQPLIDSGATGSPASTDDGQMNEGNPHD